MRTFYGRVNYRADPNVFWLETPRKDDPELPAFLPPQLDHPSRHVGLVRLQVPCLAKVGLEIVQLEPGLVERPSRVTSFHRPPMIGSRQTRVSLVLEGMIVVVSPDWRS